MSGVSPGLGSRPRDPYVDPQSRVWFCGQVGNFVAYFKPDTGFFERFDLEPSTKPEQPRCGRGGLRLVRREPEHPHRQARARNWRDYYFPDAWLRRGDLLRRDQAAERREGTG